jgi:hypothetical protein
LPHWIAVMLSDQCYLWRFEARRGYPRQNMCTASAIFLVERPDFSSKLNDLQG